MNWDQSLKPLLVIVLHLKIKCCYDRILLPAWEGHFDFILAHADLERGMWNIGQRFPARDPQGSFTRDAVGPCAGPSQTPAWHKGAVNKHCSKDTMERKNAGEHLLQGVLFPPSSVLAPVPKGIASPQTPFSRSEFTAEMGFLNFSLGNWVRRAGEFCTQNHQPEKKMSQAGTGAPGSHLCRPCCLGHPALQTLSHILALQRQPEFRLCLEECHSESQMCQPYYHHQQTS